jgi:hypothetical protein
MSNETVKRVALGARVPAAIADAVKIQAAERDVSVSRVIMDALVRQTRVEPEVTK